MAAAAELPAEVHAKVTELGKAGDELSHAGKFQEARTLWHRAWLLLPEPRQGWEAASWLLAAIGDTYVQEGRFSEALVPLQQAMSCPGGLGNPFLHLRLGQAQYEVGNTTRAKDELARAFMGGGDRIFEDEDPKYWRFIREVLRPPASETGQ